MKRMGHSDSRGVQVLKRGDSLRSIQQGHADIRLLYEGERLDVLTIEIEPRASVQEAYLWNGPSIHLIAKGELVYAGLGPGSPRHLIGGDTIFLEEGRPYRIHNLAATRAAVYILLLKEEGGEEGGAS